MQTEKIAAFAKQLGCDVLIDEPMSEHTTFRVGGPCSCMIIPHSADALSKLVVFSDENNIRTLILGKGSNMLCEDEGYDGAVILIDGNLSDITLIDDTTIRAYAGASLAKVCRFALDNSLKGMEFAYGIPGTVGGAVFMNAGAYGGEIKDVVTYVTVLNKKGELITYDNSQLNFTYRGSRFTNSGEIVLYADFSLENGCKEDIEAAMKDVMYKRKSKQPLEYPSAGSTFKRPEGSFAGMLIEQCGFRGYSVGGAQVSEKHCGFVINKENATCQDIKQLIKIIQDTVLEKTGYILDTEVKLIPFRKE